MKKLLATLLAGMLLLTGCTGSTSEQPAPSEEPATEAQVLKIGAIPDFDQEKLTAGFGSFAEDLSSKIGIPVEYVPTVDYASLVTAFERGEIDLAWFWGLT